MEMAPVVDEDDENDAEDFRLNFSDEFEGKLGKASFVVEESEWRNGANIKKRIKKNIA